MKTRIILLTTLLSSFTALCAAWGQAPPPQPPSAKAVPPQASHPNYVLRVNSDNLVLSDTGKSPVDKAAVRAREDRDNQSYRIVLDGEAFFKAGQTQEAIASYENALAISPTDKLAYQRLAEADIACGKLDEASQNFHKILVEGFKSGFGPSAGGNQDVWAEYALVLLKTKHEADALSAYNKAAFIADYEVDLQHQNKLIPNIPSLFPEVVMGDALPEQVQYTPERLQALTDALLAHTQSGFWSYKEIKAHAQEAAKLYPDSAPVQYYLGVTLSGSYYAVIDSPAKDKAAALAAYEEDRKGEEAAYKKAAELGDDRTVAAAKNRLTTLR